MSDLKNKVNVATKWSFATEIMAKIIVPLTNITLAHLLVPEDFGLIATINMVITFVDMLADSGFGRYLVQHNFSDSDSFDNAVNVAFWTNFIIATFMWFLIFVFRDTVAIWVGSGGYGIPLVVACLAIPLTSLSVIPISVLQKRLDYKNLFFNRMVASLTPFIISVTLALNGFRYWSLIIGMLCSYLAQAIVLGIRARWCPKFYYNFTVLKEMFVFGVWILLESFAMWACTWIDIFIISNSFDAYHVGLYKTAQTTVTGILSVVTASVNSIIFVTLSKLQNSMQEFYDTFYSFQKKLAVLVVPMGVGLWLYRDFITFVLLGRHWAETAEFLGTWGFCMAMVATMGTFCREALRAKGMPKISFVVQILHLAFIIPVMLIVKNFGYRILTFVRSLAYLESILLLHIFVKIYIDISPIKILKNTVWPLICAVIMGILGYYMQVFLGLSVIGYILNMSFSVVIYFSLLSLMPYYRNLLLSVVRKQGC